MWMSQRILCFVPPIAPIRFIRWKHTAITNRGKGLGNLHEEVNRRFTQRILERLHRWDGVNGNDWFMIYRDNHPSRFVLLVTIAVPVIGFLTSENCIADVKDGRLLDAFKDTNIVRQMGILVVLPMFSLLLVTYLAWHLNAIRIHRIYVNKKEQKTFIAVISHCGIFTRKIPFTRHNIRILESAGHQLWSFVKGSIKINKHRFMLNDEGFRDIQYRHLMLGRNTKSLATADKSKKTIL
ncbi:putative integral membrane protein [Acanthocheilonema viteae]